MSPVDLLRQSLPQDLDTEFFCSQHPVALDSGGNTSSPVSAQCKVTRQYAIETVQSVHKNTTSVLCLVCDSMKLCVARCYYSPWLLHSVAALKACMRAATMRKLRHCLQLFCNLCPLPLPLLQGLGSDLRWSVHAHEPHPQLPKLPTFLLHGAGCYQFHCLVG